MKQRMYIITGVLALMLSMVSGSQAKGDTGAVDRSLNVCDLGAAGDGKTLDTRAIQSAVDRCSEKGGTVIFPKGVFLTGTIYLKDNVTLWLDAGAVILGSPDIKDYPPNTPDITFYGSEWVHYALFYAEGKKNITIKGRGTIDGQGSKFIIENNKKPYRYMNRPYIFWFVKSGDIHIENIHLKNSAFWMQHYLACNNVTIRGINVYNHSNKNNDMIDIDGCKNVHISDCTGDSDDDALTIKSTCGRISENITVTNCVLSSHCNALKCGTESTGGFRNIVISNCVIKPSVSPEKIYGKYKGDGGISLEVVDGGVMEHVIISNIVIDGPEVPVFIRLGNRGRAYRKDQGVIPVGEQHDIVLSHIIARSSGNIGCSITGIPGHEVSNITLDHVQIHVPGGIQEAKDPANVPENEKEYPEGNMFGILPSYGLYIRHVNNISLQEVTFYADTADSRPAVVADDVQGLVLNGVHNLNQGRSKSIFWFKNSKNMVVSQCRSEKGPASFLHISGEKSGPVYIFNNILPAIQNIVTFSDGAEPARVTVKNNFR